MGLYDSNFNSWQNAGNTVLATDQEYMPQGYSWFANNNQIQWVNIGGTNFNWQNLLHTCPALLSIISKKCDAISSGIVEVVRFNEKDEAKKVRGIDKDWVTRMNNPNHIQSWTTFIRQLYYFLGIRGWCYIMPVYAEGFKDRAPIALWLLPPWHTTVIPIMSAPPLYELEPDTKRRDIYFSWQGKRYTLNEQELILVNDPGAITIDENTWLPNSRLLGLSYAVSNNQAQYESRNMLIKSTGGWGIFSSAGKDGSGTLSLTPTEKKQVEQDIKDYGSLKNQMPFIVSTMPMTYTPISRNAKELELHQENAATIQDMCDRFNYPFHLMSAAAGKEGSSIFNNVEESKKYMYDTIIYEAAHICNELNNGFSRLAGSNNEPDESLPKVRVTFDHIECLQESEAEAATGEKYAMEAMIMRWEAGCCTLNDIIERMGEDRKQEPEFDLYKPQYDKWLLDNGLAPQINIAEQPSANLNNLENQSKQKPQQNA